MIKKRKLAPKIPDDLYQEIQGLSRWMDGMEFVQLTYDCLNHARAHHDAFLLRRGPIKKLIDEALPTAQYILNCYSPIRQFDILWRNNDQDGDAVLINRGILVEENAIPKRTILEITLALHQNDYLRREHNAQGEVAYSALTTSRDSTGEIVSTPYVYTNSEHQETMAKLVIARIQAKSKKAYANNTELLVAAFPDSFFIGEEWTIFIDLIREKLVKLNFANLFISDINHNNRFIQLSTPQWTIN